MTFPTPFTDETIEHLTIEEVFLDLAGLAERGTRASLQVRSPDGREILAQVNGEIGEVRWDDELPGDGRTIEVRGEGWVVFVPERDFRGGRIWLACGGLTIEMDGYSIEAGLAYDGPPDEPLGPDPGW